MTSEHHFRAVDATYTGAPADFFECDKIDWMSVDGIRSLIDERGIVAATLDALLYLLAERGGTATTCHGHRNRRRRPELPDVARRRGAHS
ncbi:hypothetical protein [Dactylosporangium sp. CA-139066]|uniref:hypothetical protein n=1 Tax=Dactylosporangium sp. CA-139066 TaxID=3239930 RepID=UPI003D92227D